MLSVTLPAGASLRPGQSGQRGRGLDPMPAGLSCRRGSLYRLPPSVTLSASIPGPAQHRSRQQSEHGKPNTHEVGQQDQECSIILSLRSSRMTEVS